MEIANILFYTYFGVAALILGFGCVEVGSRASDKLCNKGDIIQIYAGAATMWPMVLVGVLVWLPFYCLYKLGHHLRGLR